jgi:hypothetical protein
VGWSGISFAGLFALQQGSMTAQQYRDKVLDIHVKVTGDDFIQMDDNATLYRARIVQ